MLSSTTCWSLIPFGPVFHVSPSLSKISWKKLIWKKSADRWVIVVILFFMLSSGLFVDIVFRWVLSLTSHSLSKQSQSRIFEQKSAQIGESLCNCSIVFHVYLTFSSIMWLCHTESFPKITVEFHQNRLVYIGELVKLFSMCLRVICSLCWSVCTREALYIVILWCVKTLLRCTLHHCKIFSQNCSKFLAAWYAIWSLSTLPVTRFRYI